MDVRRLIELIDEANQSREPANKVNYYQPQKAIDPVLWEFWQGEDSDSTDAVTVRLVDEDRVSRAYQHLSERFGLAPLEVAAAPPVEQSASMRFWGLLDMREWLERVARRLP